MDLAAAFYAAVAEVADGKVAEIEVERTFVDDEGELTTRFVIRRDPWRPAPVDIVEDP
mgnify:CR=1 FL=1|jgi:hypothetical protein